VGYRWPTGREVREAEDRANALDRLRADPCVAEGMAGLEVNGQPCNPSRRALVGDPFTNARSLPWQRFMTVEGPYGMREEIRHTRGSRAAGW
jgi:hypothetical protein